MLKEYLRFCKEIGPINRILFYLLLAFFIYFYIELYIEMLNQQVKDKEFNFLIFEYNYNLVKDKNIKAKIKTQIRNYIFERVDNIE
jgi:hypothetical protein